MKTLYKQLVEYKHQVNWDTKTKKINPTNTENYIEYWVSDASLCGIINSRLHLKNSKYKLKLDIEGSGNGTIGISVVFENHCSDDTGSIEILFPTSLVDEIIGESSLRDRFISMGFQARDLKHNRVEDPQTVCYRKFKASHPESVVHYIDLVKGLSTNLLKYIEVLEYGI